MDSVLIYALQQEIKKNFYNRKVQKIVQLEKDKFLLDFGEKALYLCASPTESFFYSDISENVKNKKESHFQDLLKKYIAHGILTKIEQPKLERILFFHFQKTDPLGIEKTECTLIFELIGRQSNLILCENNNKIIECLRRFSSQDAPRQLLPEKTYKLPQSMGETSLLDLDRATFTDLLKKNNSISIKKAMFTIICDISPQIIEQLLLRANLEPKTLVNQLEENQKQSVFNEILWLKWIIEKKNFSPTILLNKRKEVQKIYPILPQNTQNYEVKIFDSGNEACTFYYKNLTKLRKKQSILGILEKNFEKEKNKAEKKLEIRKKELASAERYEEYKLFGELISANMHRLKRGMEEAKLENYYDPKMKKISIPLDPALTPQKNAENYFKKYKKSKSGLETIAQQIKVTEKKLEKLEDLGRRIEEATSLEELMDLKKEMKEKGLFVTQKPPTQKEREKNSINPRTFETSEGWTVLVGRNNKENDHLTLYIAKKDDIWLHVQGATGSHVILKREGRKGISPKALYEAAKLAARYSSAKHSNQVPVIYTEKRYVRKPKGSLPGRVVCSHEKTIFVSQPF